MTWKNARRIIEARRERVASLRLRGLTQREIVEAFKAQGFVNPETGKAWSNGTIATDFLALDKQWRKSAERATSEHKAEQLAELQEARRRAWAVGDMPEVRQNIALEVKILGTEAPTKLEHTGKDGGPIETETKVTFDHDSYAKLFGAVEEPADKDKV